MCVCYAFVRLDNKLKNKLYSFITNISHKAINKQSLSCHTDFRDFVDITRRVFEKSSADTFGHGIYKDILLKPFIQKKDVALLV